MRTVFLDAELADRAAILDRLATQLGFPAHFGANLDALWDVLRTDVAGPYEIVWRDHARARAALGPEFERLSAMLRRLAVERDDVTFRLA